MNQLRESRVAADRVEVGMGFDELQDIRLFLRGLLKPDKSLFIFSEAEVCVHECSRWNVSRMLPFLQLREEPKRVFVPACVCVGSDEHAKRRRAALGKGNSLFKFRDCLRRSIICSQDETKRQKSSRIVGSYGESAA